MNKKQLIEFLMESLSDDAIYELPNFELERPGNAISFRDCGYDHNGFAVIRPDRVEVKGELTITYTR
jgi:hypothetical protein